MSVGYMCEICCRLLIARTLSLNKFIVSAVDSRYNREGRWFFTDKYSLLVCKYVITHYQVVIAVRSHLFPFRTEKLSSLAPMVLQCNAGE